MANMLTTKEATLVSDLLAYEESAAKKARLYSKILTDQTLSDKFKALALNHEERFKTLFESL